MAQSVPYGTAAAAAETVPGCKFLLLIYDLPRPLRVLCQATQLCNSSAMLLQRLPALRNGLKGEHPLRPVKTAGQVLLRRAQRNGIKAAEVGLSLLPLPLLLLL
ncbi:hypothetical protein TYRP_016814 [Tyrophagus putrescentiae]|nr:hypothetical protein TYRP_016814 [Tyrophagus putrescentiae]